jgi:putative exosortase-associated protein (TIGR04073 family)
MKSHRNAVSMTSAIALLALGVWSPSASADTPGEKAGRGLAAMATPFLEIPGNIIAMNRREGPVEAWTMGLARGIGMTIVRPGVGVYELVTAPIPVPKNYEPILEPEYPWSYFGSGEHRSGVARR